MALAGVKDVRRKGLGGGIRRYALLAESASTGGTSHGIDPVLWPGRSGLVAGELAHICKTWL